MKFFSLVLTLFFLKNALGAEPLVFESEALAQDESFQIISQSLDKGTVGLAVLGVVSSVFSPVPDLSDGVLIYHLKDADGSPRVNLKLVDGLRKRTAFYQVLHRGNKKPFSDYIETTYETAFALKEKVKRSNSECPIDVTVDPNGKIKELKTRCAIQEYVPSERK